MSFPNILIASPVEERGQRLVRTLEDAGCTAQWVRDTGVLYEQLARDVHDLLVLDHLFEGGGPDALRRVKERHRSLLVTMVGYQVPAQAIIETFREGAWDFLLEPVEPQRLAELAERARRVREQGAERRKLSEQLESQRQQVEELRRRLDGVDPFEKFVGVSPTLRGVVETLREVARTDSTVLLTGESGTGKGLAAQAIHEASMRKGGPFVTANCVVYSEGVLHSELFGHEKGAFTGAAKLKRGRFELAQGGTLMLDEIGDISPATQLLLLRVLQERVYERVGGEETFETDVRLIAATNRNLQEAMLRGEFRSDLFYRLNVIPVHLPPLRDRADDIPALAQHFVLRSAEKLGREVRGLTPEALDGLCSYAWPGNIRELENVVERLVVLSRGPVIEEQDLPDGMRRKDSTRSSSGSLQDLERERIVEVLRGADGNKKLAAQRLGIHRSTLYAKLKKYGLDGETETAAAVAAMGGVS